MKPFQAPLVVQVLLVLTGGVFASMGLAFAVLVLNPAPGPEPIYLNEVAQALQMGPLETRSGHRLVRTITRARPPALAVAQSEGEPDHPDPRHARKHVLEVLLKAPSSAVGLMESRPEQPPVRLSRRSRFPQPGPPRMGEWWAADHLHPHRPEDEVVLGAFTAVLARADGSYVVVTSGPRPFPTPWQKAVMAWLAGAAGILVILSLWFARRITAPLDAFAKAAQGLGRNPNGAAIAETGPLEIRRAAKALNDMQVRLRRYVQDRTGMIGAISHDLRTPLTRIRFRLEARQIDKAAIEQDLDQMEAMITKVLAFLRDSRDPERREAIDFLSLVETCIDDALVTGIPLRPVGLDAPGLEGVLVEGDVASLKRILANLLDNVGKYGVSADVEARLEGGEVILSIIDQGPGLSEAECEAVFTPFHRTEAARTLDDRGVGLGLAVARSLARAHGGDITLHSQNPGLTARLRLPVLNPLKSR